MNLTYANEAAGIEVIKTPNHTIRVATPTETESQDPFTENSPSESKTPLTKTEEEIFVRVNVSRVNLENTIKLREGDILRTNRTVQTRVNQRMLRGFEGFHGELTRLWDNVENVSRKESIQSAARDKLRNDMRGKNGDNPRRYRVIREYESRKQKELDTDKSENSGLQSEPRSSEIASTDFENLGTEDKLTQLSGQLEEIRKHIDEQKLSAAQIDEAFNSTKDVAIKEPAVPTPTVVASIHVPSTSEDVTGTTEADQPSSQVISSTNPEDPTNERIFNSSNH
jgi:hypothetical protein